MSSIKPLTFAWIVNREAVKTPNKLSPYNVQFQEGDENYI